MERDFLTKVRPDIYEQVSLAQHNRGMIRRLVSYFVPISIWHSFTRLTTLCLVHLMPHICKVVLELSS